MKAQLIDRSAQKQLERQQDIEALRQGKVSAEELRRRNFMFSGIDMSRVQARSLRRVG